MNKPLNNLFGELAEIFTPDQSTSNFISKADEVNKINHFSIERVKSDIEYIAEHTPKNTHSLHISDLNFGMYPRDLEICESLAKIQQKFDYPKYIKCTTGKNQKE
mgnify:CR=1 FL=1